MRQAVMEATNGKTDYFLVNRNFPKLAAFAFEFPMHKNFGAMLGDDDKGYFDSGMLNYLESTFSIKDSPKYNASNLNYDNLFMEFVLEINLKMNKRYQYPIKNKVRFEKDKRKYYSNSGILVCRGDTLAATFKLLGGMYVADSGHQHDDVGTYQIMKNKVIVTGDIGGPLYYEGDWIDRYYRSIFNSYSHPLPVVDGKLQVRNIIYYLNSNRPKVLHTRFSDRFDEIVFDLSAAYNCSTLLSLNRTNRFMREVGKNRIRIEDTVKFSKPTKFEGAISTRGDIIFLSKKSFKKLRGQITYSNVILNFIIQSQHEFDYFIRTETQNGVKFKRLGIAIKNLKMNTNIVVVYW